VNGEPFRVNFWPEVLTKPVEAGTGAVDVALALVLVDLTVVLVGFAVVVGAAELDEAVPGKH
jgi:hypothetical protein